MQVSFYAYELWYCTPKLTKWTGSILFYSVACTYCSNTSRFCTIAANPQPNSIPYSKNMQLIIITHYLKIFDENIPGFFSI